MTTPLTFTSTWFQISLGTEDTGTVIYNFVVLHYRHVRVLSRPLVTLDCIPSVANVGISMMTPNRRNSRHKEHMPILRSLFGFHPYGLSEAQFRAACAFLQPSYVSARMCEVLVIDKRWVGTAASLSPMTYHRASLFARRRLWRNQNLQSRTLNTSRPQQTFMEWDPTSI